MVPSHLLWVSSEHIAGKGCACYGSLASDPDIQESSQGQGALLLVDEIRVFLVWFGFMDFFFYCRFSAGLGYRIILGWAYVAV